MRKRILILSLVFVLISLLVINLSYASYIVSYYINDQNHNNGNWNLVNGDIIAGRHTNINNFSVAAGARVYVKAFDGSKYGFVEINAENINVQGVIDASGAGYGGGGGGGGAPGSSGPDYTDIQKCASYNVGSGGSGALASYSVDSGGRPLGGSSGSNGNRNSNGDSISGSGGRGGGSFGGSGGASVKSSGSEGAKEGSAGKRGGYAANEINGDSSTDESLKIGSGGGGGSGGASSYERFYYSVGGSGGGGAGNKGGGYVKLIANNVLSISGAISTQGMSRVSGNGGSGDSGYRNNNLHCDLQGSGGNGGSAASSGSSSGAIGVDGHFKIGWNDCIKRDCKDSNGGSVKGGSGGVGGSGAGGGVLLKGKTVTVTGSVDSKGGDGNINGGSLKIFYTCYLVPGSFNTGRNYITTFGNCAEVLCSDNLDNDNDGKTDCSDSDCSGDSACSSYVPEICNDLIDNDGDNILDCVDSDCADAGNCQNCDSSCAPEICTPKTEICNNNWDDDCDGDSDSADSDCCTLNNVDIKASNECGSSGCSAGDETIVYSTYSDSCPSAVYVQVDAFGSHDGEDCNIEFNESLADIQGIEVSCSSSPCSKTWELPSSIPSVCKGKNLEADAAAIYSRSDYSPSSYLSGAVEVSGRFRIRGIGDCALDCDSDGDCYEECESATNESAANCAPDPDCGCGTGDADGDGIADLCDACSTLPGETVGANGCSEGDFGCALAWDCSDVEWSECDEETNLKTRIVDDCKKPDPDQDPECYASNYVPASQKECEAVKEFPFFSWVNMLIAVSLLIGYYVWRKKY